MLIVHTVSDMLVKYRSISDCSTDPSKKDWWLNKLHSLGIHPKKVNALNDTQEQII